MVVKAIFGCHMGPVLHDATTFLHQQLCLTTIDASSAVLDSNTEAEHDVVSTMPLWCHLAGYAGATTNIHIQPDGCGDPAACVLPARQQPFASVPF